MGDGAVVTDAAAEFTASGRRKRKDTGAKREGAAKGWTEDEERLFLEGLEFFGREWHKAAGHVGNAIATRLTICSPPFMHRHEDHDLKICWRMLPSLLFVLLDTTLSTGANACQAPETRRRLPAMRRSTSLSSASRTVRCHRRWLRRDLAMA